MYSRAARRCFIPVVLISLIFLVGCSGMEFAPKKGIWYYPTELPQAERAVEKAKTAGKDKECPAEFSAAKDLKDNSYEVYWSCNTKKAIEMANEAANKANALCPCKPKPEAKPAKEIDRFILTINFAFDKADITKSDAAQLRKALDFIAKYPGSKIVLEGHTDSVGTEKYNQKLSERRADATKQFLVTKGKILDSRISTMGYGESRPIASNKTKSGRAENRRVEIVIISE